MLILARHGVTDWNRERRMQGRSDNGLNEEGLLQARTMAGALAGLEPAPITRAVVSSLTRAQQTARELARTRPELRFETDPRLAEVDLGAWEGRLESELLEEEAFRAWRTDPVRHVPPGGEGALDVARRVAPLLDELAGSPSTGPVLLLGHQFTNGVIDCLVNGFPLDRVRSRLSPAGGLRRLLLPRREPS